MLCTAWVKEKRRRAVKVGEEGYGVFLRRCEEVEMVEFRRKEPLVVNGLMVASKPGGRQRPIVDRRVGNGLVIPVGR